MGIYEQLAAEHAERERAQRERAQQMAAMAAREAAMREASQRAQAQYAQAQHAAARAAATHAATQRAALQRAAAQRATGAQATGAAGQYPGYQNPRYQQPPAPLAPPFPPGLQQSAPQPPAPAPAPAPLAPPASANIPAPASADTPMPAIKGFKSLSIKRTPKPKAPIPAPADKNTDHNLSHYKSLPTVGPENVDALHLMAVGTSIWALAAVGLSILLSATASRSAALEICLCGIVIGVIGMAWGGVHEYRKALGRGPLSEDNSTPVDDVAAGEALSLRYRDI